MTSHIPPLLIIGSYPDSFNLRELLRSDMLGSEASLVEDKYQGLDRFEIITQGMSFELELFDKSETSGLLRQNCVSTLFSSPADSNSQAIGIWLGENLDSGKHLPTINQALLRIASTVGQAVTASHIGWFPAQHSIDFEHFKEAVEDYLDGGPTPVLIQVAMNKIEENVFATKGLGYFSGQEINLSAAKQLSESECIKRLVRICHDISVNGKIDGDLETAGLEQCETIIFRPSEDRSQLDVNIKIDLVEPNLS